ncbi:MAG TPA: hypothetical protein VGA02_09940 [Gemmatimonadales bacterium]
MPDKPADMPVAFASQPYTASAWDEDAFAAYAEGRDPRPCPVCGRVGFFGPRVVGVMKVRACRFCGLYQEAEGPPLRATPTVHACAEWPEIARAPYIWWVPPGDASYTCSFCRTVVKAADCLVTPPSEDSKHPWWRVPQGRNRFYYARFWENWPFTKGRVFL